MIFGQYSPAYIPLLASAIGIFSIIACYYIAIQQGHEKPLPHTWISKTAQHYPQFLIFRIGTISNGVLIILSYFYNYFWMETVSRQHVFNIGKYKPKIILFLGITGILALFGSTALIDTGRMKEHWHEVCASTFFACSILAILYNTFVISGMFSHTKAVRMSSMILKIFISLGLLVQLYLGVMSGAYSSFQAYHDSDLGHYLEFTLAFSVLGYFATFALDLKGFKMIYRKQI